MKEARTSVAQAITYGVVSAADARLRRRARKDELARAGELSVRDPTRSVAERNGSPRRCAA
ncbi:hypothetical protein DB771_26760 [Burkholderia sp. AU29985]|nr:hypothetical protein EGY28_00410 [Burkholderia dolosa]PRE49571.1 hypothetical protein C6P87_13920 [Burkholderia sp. AU12872]PUA73902.1 hypothetical protein DB771_26760 [Burkholderia sp. AU29985]